MLILYNVCLYCVIGIVIFTGISSPGEIQGTDTVPDGSRSELVAGGNRKEDRMEHDLQIAPEVDLKEDPQKAPDLGGRRKKVDRRGRSTAGTFPERRWQRHRRDGGDRRSFPFFSSRRNRERRDTFKETDQEGNC